MRRILVDFARHRKYQKRGGDWRKVTLAKVGGTGRVDTAWLTRELKR